MLPLEATLSRLGAVGARLSLEARPGRRAIPVEQLLGDRAALAQALGRCGASLGFDREVAASQFVKHWAVSVLRPAVAVFASERRVPDVSPGNTVLVLDGIGRPVGVRLRSPRLALLPDDPAAGDPSAVVVPDETALRAWLWERAVAAHLGLAVDAVASVVAIEPVRLWGNVAAAGAGALAALSARGEPVDGLRADMATLFDAPGQPTTGLARLISADQDGELRLRVGRETCCLHHRLPGSPPPCLSCPLLSEGERARRTAAAAAQ